MRMMMGGQYADQAHDGGRFSVQFLCGGANGCMPIACDVAHGSNNDIACFKRIVQQVDKYNLSAANYYVLADKDNCSSENMEDLERSGSTFIF